VWYLWWLQQGAIGPIEATPLWVTVDWPDFWIHTFRLVIRLSKVKQLAFRLLSLFEMSRFSGCPLKSFGKCILYGVKPFRTAKNFIFTAAASAFEVQPDMCDRRQQACPLPAGVVSLVSGEVEHIVHLIHWNLHSCYMPSWLTWLLSKQGNNARPLGIYVCSKQGGRVLLAIL